MMKSEVKRTILNGKPTRRVSGLSSRSRVSGSLRRGLEKRASAVHVLRDSSNSTSSKESTHTVVSKQDDQQLMDKSVKIATLSNTDALEGRSGGSGSSDIGRKKLLLLKKEKEVSNVSGTSSLPQNATTPAKNSHTLNPLKQNKQREGARWIRSTHRPLSAQSTGDQILIGTANTGFNSGQGQKTSPTLKCSVISEEYRWVSRGQGSY